MKILVIGCGSIGYRHIKNLRSLGIRDIRACDIDAKKLGKIKRELRIRVFRNINSALEEKPDAALVCTPPATHVQIAKELLEKEIHVFIEKPLSHSLKGVNKLISQAKKKNLIISVGYNFRFHPGLRKIKTILTTGKLGRILWGRAIFGQYLPDWRPNQDYKKSYTAIRSKGGGIILDGSHEIDYMRWLLGEVKYVCCVARKLSSLKVNVEDTADVLMQHRDKKISNIHIDFVRRDYFRECEIVGENGSIRWSFPRGNVDMYLAKKRKWFQIYPGCGWNKMYVEEIKHFIKCLQGKEIPIVDAMEGKKTLETVLAAKKSAKMKRAVKVGT